MNLTVFACVALIATCLAGISCDSRTSSTAPTAPSTQPSKALPTVASLAPAATDLILGMGCGDHLVAVSNFDDSIPGIPQVGDYQNTDWEKLSEIRPTIMIVQMEESRLPQGLRDRATALNIRLVNIQIERLDDIFRTLEQLGDTLNERTKANRAEASVRSRLEAVKNRVTDQPPVPTLISLDDDGAFAAGPNTFLDDLLTIAGGRNVLSGTSQHWPSIDKERLFSLAPSAVIELLPGASAQVEQRAASFWASVPNVPAVSAGRIYPITDRWVMTPGIHVADLAETIAADLHPPTIAKAPTTQAIP